MFLRGAELVKDSRKTYDSELSWDMLQEHTKHILKQEELIGLYHELFILPYVRIEKYQQSTVNAIMELRKELGLK